MRVGARVRVRGWPGKDPLNGLVGWVEKEPDCYGRWGVVLDDLPRPSCKRWWYFHADYLENPQRPSPLAGDPTKEEAKNAG